MEAKIKFNSAMELYNAFTKEELEGFRNSSNNKHNKKSNPWTKSKTTNKK